jgi:beta-fructofuranosidase
MRLTSAVIAFLLIIAAAIPGEAETMTTIRDKTLVAWVHLANTTQQGGTALTLDDQSSHFDGIVFGEIAPARWMAGSDGWRRSQRDQATYPEETADPATCVQIAIVYRGAHVAVYRDGKPYAEHDVQSPQSFGHGSVAVLGLRHLEAGNRSCLAGAIEDARIYDVPLDAEQIAALHPNQPSDPEPLAWWSFEDGRTTDRMGLFPDSILLGGARVAEGKLHLTGEECFMVALPQNQAEEWLTASARTGPGGGRFQAVRAHREDLLADPQRPAYHFVAPEGTCMPFDPNGAIFWKGRYHLCYIFQDERGHCWGHASSADLVHWRFHTPALFPAPGDPDRHIFSGNAFVNLKGEATLLYHGVDAGNCIATCAEDGLDHWTKLPSNPIVPNPKEGDPEHGVYASWDPHGWVENDTYYAIFGGHPGSGVPATLFKSENITDWEYLHPILEREMPGVSSDDDLSCPDFFKIGDKHMLMCISHKRGCRYYLGRWEDERFHPESHAWMNWPGGTCFAPESLLDDQGRRIMWAWALDRFPAGMRTQHGWSGTMTLPRVLSLADDGTLRIEPVEELSMLRQNHRHFGDVAVAADSEVKLDNVQGDCLELAVRVRHEDAGQVGVKVRCSPDGDEQTIIAYDPASKQLIVDFSRSTLDPGIAYHSFCMGGGENPRVTAQKAPFELKPDEPLDLRIFLDRSIMEVFANGRQCLTQRLYPTRADSLGVVLFATGADAAVESVDVWDMAAANAW